MKERQFVLRAAAAVIILLNLAVVTVLFEAKGMKLRYELAKKREAAAGIAQENRALAAEVAQQRQPGVVQQRAAEQGVRAAGAGENPRR